MAADPAPQDHAVIYDEALVPHYTLPDPLVDGAGAPVIDRAGWRARRAQLLATFADQVYGRTPAGAPPMQVTVEEEGPAPMAGQIRRKQVRLAFDSATGRVALHLLLYLPRDRTTPVPTFLGLNFQGNHTIHPDPAILLPAGRAQADAAGSRGAQARRWPVEAILQRGYGLATLYCGDADPDVDDGFVNGVHGLFGDPGTPARPDHAWGALGAWAWALSRALDSLEEEPVVDGARVGVMGHSRLGKAALWAGAQDERFALVISNESGCGGAALSRRRFGETVRAINDRFPHWFCRNFRAYNDHEETLPVDQHMLLALIAPRPLYVASAQDDLWADPSGEFLAAVAAAPVYRLLGAEGLPTEAMPPADAPAMGDALAYHMRSGAHDVTAFDWACYLAFADRVMAG